MTLLPILLTITAATALQQVDPAVCPLHASHAVQQHTAGAGHHAEMEARGTKAMGFDQSRASHHFRLAPDGGAIEVHINTKNDESTRKQVVAHLEEISRKFKAGDFGIPAVTHGQVPPGVTQMARHRDAIEYVFEPSPAGGTVTIRTQNREALDAVHAFLRYQIQDHGTGDPTAIKR